MGVAIYGLYAAAHAALAGLAARQAARRTTWTILVVLVLAVTISYDNLMLVLGNAIGEGDTLRLLSWPRFIIHALVTPVSIAVVIDLGRRLGVPRLQAPRAMTTTWVVVAMFVAFGTYELLHLELEAKTGLGLLRYGSVEAAPPIAPIVAVIAMIAVGWSVRRRTGWSLLFVLGVVSFVGSAVPPIEGLLIFGNLVEIAFVAGLFLAEQRATSEASPHTSDAAPVQTPAG